MLAGYLKNSKKSTLFGASSQKRLIVKIPEKPASEQPRARLDAARFRP
jgi:hypothetical protein